MHPLPAPLPVAAPGVTLWSLPAVVGPGDAVRDILVATPPGYDPSRRYPVLYCQDGQNLLDPATSYAGTHWALLETLAEQGAAHPAIVVAIPHREVHRITEYSPFDDIVRGRGEGAAYLHFLVRTVRPAVEAAFAVRRGRRHSALIGSSMGGLIALYGVTAGAAAFGAAWAMSPALWYAQGRIFDWVRHAPGPVGRIALDIGLEEGADAVLDVRRMRDLLLDRGWVIGPTLDYREDPEGDHDEASWARRLAAGWPRFIRWLG
ncbi:MAG TPA: alpha/beta hydrolase-fold protein, partial [Gemmatimonadales bacterium]|nr:alpha/beta hydrolase-fold protein [Gemmatimonadales bacterium]